MSGSERGRSLELYFIDGKPDGMLTAEVFNWTGHVLMTPRTQIAKALSREEASRTGVYILVGELGSVPMVYIGEAEDISRRMKDHIRDKDWWTNALFITTAGDGLHKAHVKYLEARLINIANDVGAVKLENGNAPAKTSLSEAHVANMEFFLGTLLMVLPALRLDIFLDKKRVSRDRASHPARSEAVFFEYQSAKLKLTAQAELDGSDFVVLQGSQARKAWVGERSERNYYWKLHDFLVQQGILVLEGDVRIFAEDYAFSSTSAAAAVVTGRSAAGPMEWKVRGTKKTYKQWEADQVEMPEK